MPILYHTATGRRAPLPHTKSALSEAKADGWSLAEILIDTATGAPMVLSAEANVNGGQGAIRALKKSRRDAGHEHQSAFMAADEWERLSPEERAAYARAPATFAADAHANPNATAQTAQALALQTAQLVAQGDRLRELEAKLRMLESVRPDATAPAPSPATSGQGQKGR